jgi:predicted SnoaL-like aldol condensation-catalyzing enzyme
MITAKEKVVQLLKSIETTEEEPLNYINPNKYIEHNPKIKDGLEGFRSTLLNHSKEKFKVKIIRVFEDGDKVFTHSKYNCNGFKVGFDIFRFEKGLIVEHWDNLTEIVEKTASGRSQIDGPTKVTDLNKTERNKELVKEFYNKILIHNQYDEISKFFKGDKYLQHNISIPDGVLNLVNIFSKRMKQGNATGIQKMHYLMGQGNFVLTVGEGSWGDGTSAFYDLFRIENNKIVEHWDVVSEIPSKKEWLNNNGKF